MIKIEELKVCASINRAASVKKDKKGASYLSCGVVLPIIGKNGETKELFINVMMAPSKGNVSELTVGRRVNLVLYCLSLARTVRRKSSSLM